MKVGVTNIINGMEEGRFDWDRLAKVVVGFVISYLSRRNMLYNFKGLLSTGDNLARSSRISETASETMESGKGCKGSTNAAETPSAYGKGHDIETNGFGPDTIINRNANYGAKTADPSYGVATKPIGNYQLEINTPSRSSYVTGTSRTGMAAGAEENIWLKAGNGTGVSGTPGRKVPGSLGSTGLDVGKPKVPDVPEIAGKGYAKNQTIILNDKGVAYPEIMDIRTGQNVAFPEEIGMRVPKENRVGWYRSQNEANLYRTNNTDILCKKDYIDEWYRRGYDTPEGGWDLYEIHHIKPREFGGRH